MRTVPAASPADRSIRPARNLASSFVSYWPAGVGVLILLLLGMVLPAAPAKAQTTEICLGRVITTLNFSATPTLQSGTALAAGAVYRYSNVNSGIDALVRIVALNNGASLTTIDNNTAPLAGQPDLRPFFNPELGGSNARSVDFQISFVVAGSNTPLPFDFAATAIDVDGDSGSIREYAEFQNSYAEYLLNNPTNLSVNASGPTAGNTRFESTTSLTAGGIDPAANQNIVATFYAKSSGFRYRIGTLGSGTSVRLTSLQFTCPNLPAPTATTKAQDFGDAPASYGNPRHDLIAGYRLGATITSETGPYNHATATADAGDDGVTAAATVRAGTTASATIAVTGAGGRLQAWIDWNRDGDFSDAGEQVAQNVGDNLTGDTNAATGTIGLSYVVPVDSVPGQTFARFRWSTQSGLNASTIVGHDGEVEDYAVTVLGTAVLSVTKTNAVYAPTSFTDSYLPSNDVIYTITTSNVGTAATDADSIFMLDSLPPQVEIYVGDFDAAGPSTGTILFAQQNGAALSFAQASDVRFSSDIVAPATFALCNYTPPLTNVYDPAIRHVCVNPKNALAMGNPRPGFTVQFRARIK